MVFSNFIEFAFTFLCVGWAYFLLEDAVVKIYCMYKMKQGEYYDES